jgi:hypothetical protein
MKPIDLSVIIISFNTKQILVDCINSVVKNTKGFEYEIIVVDNGSTDDSIKSIKEMAKKFPQVKLIDTGENIGFGRGNNEGIKAARGEYLLLLNSDTIITDNVLGHSIKRVKELKSIGAYSCKLLNRDLSLQPSGGHFPTLSNLIAWQLFIDDLPFVGKLIPSFHPQLSRYGTNQSLDWVTGAFMIIPKNAFE